MNKIYPVIEDCEKINSPGLWIDKQLVQVNIDQMITDVGGPDFTSRLRPHVKTHKMREIVEMQVESGITKCKASTPMEARISAEGGATDILIAHQLVGPKISEVGKLIEEFPRCCFSSIVDDEHALAEIAAKLGSKDRPFPVRIDVDCGMHRSGIPFGENLDKLRDQIEKTEGIVFAGLHVYDGHLHDPDLDSRKRDAKEIIKTVRNYLFDKKVPAIVGGGSPTFKIWAEDTDWECSPGTTIFWDFGYGENYPDLNYQIAAGLITRVISKPGKDLICLDLGHKSIAAEMPLEKRVFFPELSEYELVGQSEEHLVVRVKKADNISVGDVFTAIPKHICPTVALHDRATVLENRKNTGEQWHVAARSRFPVT